MSFSRYITRHYTVACVMQRAISNDIDMVNGLRTQAGPPAELVSKWMRSYGLFQGINNKDRLAVVRAFLEYSKSLAKKRTPLSSQDIRDHYQNLLLALHLEVERGWMSATSKLLWCIYPRDIVIYDTFVHRSLVVLQCIEPCLNQFDRVGAQPKIEVGAEIGPAIDHYMNYQSMVKHLLDQYQPLLDILRSKHAECYPYDIRIIDKLLWMIGNPSKHY